MAASGTVKVDAWREGGGGQEAGRQARRRTLPRASPHALSIGKQTLDGLARLRSELQGVTTQASSKRKRIFWLAAQNFMRTWLLFLTRLEVGRLEFVRTEPCALPVGCFSNSWLRL